MTDIKTPVSAFARFALGDIKGGQAAHAFRIETVRTAIEQCFKGNYSPMQEAVTLADGKAKKARAYHAGFAALGVTATEPGQLAKVAYVGALNSHDNKAARETIAAKTGAACASFFVAFDAILAEKAAPKAPKVETVAPAAQAGAPAASEEATEDAIRHELAVSIDSMVEQVAAMIRAGTLTTAQLETIDEALLAVSLPTVSSAPAEQLAAVH